MGALKWLFGCVVRKWCPIEHLRI